MMSVKLYPSFVLSLAVCLILFFKYSHFPLAFTFSTIVNKDVLLQYKLELKEITACFVFSQYPENVLNMKS